MKVIKMEVSMSSISVAIVVVTLVTSWVLNLLWFRPKKLERFLRRQGLKGSSYKLLHGDLKESFSMKKEANSRPIGLSDDIVPRILPFENHIIQKYGKNSFMWFGPSPRVMITEPELIKDVLAKFAEFQKHELIKLGLATLEGEKWASRRKIVNPAFHAEKLKLMLPAFNLSCSELVKKWQNLIPDEAGSRELDVWPYFENMTGDAISRTSFGSSYEEGRVIFELQKEKAKLVIKINQSSYFPRMRFVPTKIEKQAKEIDNKIQFMLKGIIRRKEKSIKMGEAINNDLLGILLESNMNEIRDNQNKNVGMSISDVIEECKLFYFAGQETTSVLLTWTIVLLSQHQVWQDRAREEVFQVFGDDKPDYEGLNRLRIVTMILNEVLRLYPPSSILGRYVHKETKLGNLTLPAGSHIALPILLVHHDKMIWGEDANKFKPERFAEGISKASKNTLSFFPFGWGPRMCIGKNFSMIEAKVALVMILRSFRFELSPSYVHAPSPVITVQPQHGCKVILHKR